MATFFGKLLKGVGKVAKYVGATAVSSMGMTLPVSATNMGVAPPSTSSTGDLLQGGYLPTVTITAPAPGSDKTIAQKLLDTLDVISGNRPIQTNVTANDVFPKWFIYAAAGLAGLFVFKKFVK